MIKGIIFDLGNTLLEFTGEPNTVGRAGASAMATWYLKKKHIKLDTDALIEAFLAERDAAYQTARQTQTEALAVDTLRTALEKIGAPPAAGAYAEAAIKVYFASEEPYYRPFSGAVDTLKLLKADGYRVGLYSNATDDLLIQRLVNKTGLRPWLSPVASSAGWGWRKPRPEPFRRIADRWELAPESVAVVGDTLDADILGAQNAGMTGILAAMTENPANADQRHIQPAAVIAALAELPHILSGIGQGVATGVQGN